MIESAGIYGKVVGFLALLVITDAQLFENLAGLQKEEDKIMEISIFP